MAHLYRYKKNNLLYTIEHLVLDIHFTNCNGFSGIYAYPYPDRTKGEVIRYMLDEQSGRGRAFDPNRFVEENFEKVAELLHI